MSITSIRQFFERAYPTRGRDAKEGEFGRVGSEGAIRVSAEVDASGTLLLEQRVVQDDIFDVAVSRHAPDLEIKLLAAKCDGQCG